MKQMGVSCDNRDHPLGNHSEYVDKLKQILPQCHLKEETKDVGPDENIVYEWDPP